MLRSSGTLTLQRPGRFSELCNMLKATLQKKTACQGTDEDEDQAENDAVAIEDAGEAIPALAAVAGEDAFAPFFAGSLPFIALQDETGLHSGR